MSCKIITSGGILITQITPYVGGSHGSCSARISSRVIGLCADAVNIDFDAGTGAPRIIRRQMARRKWATTAP